MRLNGVGKVLLVSGLVACGATMGFAWRVWTSIPLRNTTQQKFDVILVLGTPCNKDGTPSPEQRGRVLEGVSEWRRGVAPVLVMSGGAAHTNRVEADCMAQIAMAQGVPKQAILLERQAHNTVENIHFTRLIMKAHGWTSAEVVTSPSHVPRAAFLLSHFPLQWKMRACPWPPEFSVFDKFAHNWREALFTAWLHHHGMPGWEYPVRRPFLPQVDVVN